MKLAARGESARQILERYFPGTVLVHLAHPYVRDLHLHGERTWIYVSCGTGFWGPPIRLGTTAEITSIVLRSA